MKAACLLLPVVGLVACSPPPPADAPAVAPSERGPHAFDVQLTFTPRAAEKLAASNERVVVNGMYWGVAKQGAASAMDGQATLGSDEVEVAPENAKIVVSGAGVDETRIADIDGAPQVLVNVYSARRSHADNLLNCGIYEGPVSMAQQKPIEIQCDLIYDENGDPLPTAP
jgi:hypothetical protein